MKKQGKILLVGLLATLLFTGMLQAEQRKRMSELRGTFVRLTEQRVGERTYMGVVIKPLERDDHVTVLLSQRQEELVARARGLREGQRLGIAYITEGGHKWGQELGAERPREGRRQPEEDRARRGAEALWARLERLQGLVEELRAEVARLRAELQETRSPSKEVRRVVRREGQRDEDRARGERPKSEREVVVHQLEVMRMALPALKEANRADAAELLTLAIRSRELLLEGRRDEEAQRIRERAPGREQVAEILSMAVKLWREFGKAEKGAVVGQLAEQLAGRGRRQAKERAERPDQELRAVHVTVRAGETGEPQIFFREKQVSVEQLREVLHDLGDEQLLLIHVRGEVSEELVHSIMETAKGAGIQRIKVEHIKRKKQAERDQGPGMHLFLKAIEGGANIYHKERSISLEQVQEHLQDVDDPREFTLVLHVGNDVPEKIVGRLMEMAKERGIERINVTAWKKK